MYKNYIFDFYGTLVDIHTNEQSNILWKKMAEIYSVYGADYSPMELKEAYLTQCHVEEEAMCLEMGYENVEIDLTNVFISLLRKAPSYHKTEYSITSLQDWAYDIANTFRVLSRRRFKTYPHTIQVLKKLKSSGCKIFILSNAQKIFTMAEMEQSGVLPYVDQVYISSDYQMKKPQKEFLATLLKQENLRIEESIMIGNDCSSDVAVAVSNHMHSIFLDTQHYSKKERDSMIDMVCKNNPEWAPVVIGNGDIRRIIYNE